MATSIETINGKLYNRHQRPDDHRRFPPAILDQATIHAVANGRTAPRCAQATKQTWPVRDSNFAKPCRKDPDTHNEPKREQRPSSMDDVQFPERSPTDHFDISLQNISSGCSDASAPPRLRPRINLATITHTKDRSGEELCASARRSRRRWSPGRSGRRRAGGTPASSGRACKARAAAGKIWSFFPQTISIGGWCLRKYACHFGYSGGLLP